MAGVSTATMLAADCMSEERQLDPEALGDHIDRLYRAARGLSGSRQEAEDLVQETFARVLRKPRLLRSEDDLGYLLRVLRNTFISSRRVAVRRPSELPMGEEVDLIADRSGNRPEAWIESNELYAAISALPDDFRDTLIAIDIVGLSYREAARALHAREETITTRLHRARQRVATALRGPPGPSGPLREPSAPRREPGRSAPGGELQQHGGRDAGP